MQTHTHFLYVYCDVFYIYIYIYVDITSIYIYIQTYTQQKWSKDVDYYQHLPGERPLAGNTRTPGGWFKLTIRTGLGHYTCRFLKGQLDTCRVCGQVLLVTGISSFCSLVLNILGWYLAKMEWSGPPTTCSGTFCVDHGSRSGSRLAGPGASGVSDHDRTIGISEWFVVSLFDALGTHWYRIATTVTGLCQVGACIICVLSTWAVSHLNIFFGMGGLCTHWVF